MKGSGILKGVFFLWAMACAAIGTGQDLTGIWKGYFITDGGDQYKLEFQIVQKKGLVVTGVSYSYLDLRFYGKSTMSGRFSKAAGTLSIEELRTVEVHNVGGGGTCLMNYKLKFSESGKENFLEGTYLGKSENRADPRKNGKWGDCGGGSVYLRRVESSDFYVEPFLKEKPVTKTPKPAPAPKPSAPSTPKKGVPPVTGNRQGQKATSPPQPPAQKKVEQIEKQEIVEKSEAPKKISPEPLVIPRQTRSRQNETTKVVTVRNEEITVKLYDNGEIDGDTISVYLDNQLILSRKGLTAAPITLTLKLDENHPEHTLVMVAENLGRIPPNTALMVVEDGDKRHQASLTSTEQKNAMVRFRYERQEP